MFNNNTVRQSNYNNTNVSFNFENHSASGLLCKSMLRSKITRFDIGSKNEATLFSDNPYLIVKVSKKGYDGRDYEYETEVKVVVLQVLLMNDERYLVEDITEDDFNKELGLEE